VHRVAFQIGSFSIHWYGILLAIAFLVGLWTASRRAVRDGLAAERILDGGVWLIVGAIVGARALYVATYWEEAFAGKPWTEVFMVRKGGLVYYGGFVGGALGLILYAVRKKLPLWKLADALAPSIALGYVFGRLGCLMNGCCYGRVTDAPWAIHFPREHDTHGLGVHPTQIYDSLLSLVLYAGLAWLYRRKQFDGQVFACYLLGYSASRSLVELFRGDYTAYYFGGWATPAHLISFGAFAFGLLLYWKLPRPRVQAA
jgi:phosphatidylglycerol:prolipoprotein diacylglycerol transferase